MWPRTILLVPALVLVIAAAADPSPANEAVSDNDCAAKAAAEPVRSVVRIIDAETLALDDGSEVRLAGIIASRRPMSVSGALSDEPYAPEQAARAALSALVLDRSVELALSKRRRDRYGRYVAHVHVRTVGRPWVQGVLLSQGHARAWGDEESEACLAEMLRHETTARAAGRGLWSNAAFGIRAADHTRELMRLRSTFQLVEGRVMAFSESGGRLYLNFGDNWRSDFTAGVMRRKVLADKNSAEVAALRQRRVRVRGFIDRRNGPFIEIGNWAQIEVLDAASARAVEGDRARQDPPPSSQLDPPNERTPGDVTGRP